MGSSLMRGMCGIRVPFQGFEVCGHCSQGVALGWRWTPLWGLETCRGFFAVGEVGGGDCDGAEGYSGPH